MLASEQNERFDKLESMLAALNQCMNPLASTATLGKEIYLKDVQTDEHTVTLAACAAAIFSSASTAVGRSTSSVTALINDAPAFEFICDTVAGVPARTYGESTTGSEYGEPLNPQKRWQMQDWLRNTTVLEPIPDASAAVGGSTSGRNTTVGPVFTNASPNNDRTQTRRASPSALHLFCELSEDDGDLDFEVARNIFRKAEKTLAAQDHGEAKKLFQEGLAIADSLSAKRRDALELGRIRMHYADCCGYFTDELISAEHAYKQVMEEEPADAVALERVLTAGHGLSIVKLRQGDLEAAERYCRSALNGRRKARSIGKDHPDYHLTLRLLTVILYAKGACDQARHYAELLPINQRPNLEEEVAMLTEPSTMAKKWPFKTPTVAGANATDMCFESPRERIESQRTADLVHPPVISDATCTTEARERNNGESPNLDRSGPVQGGAKRTSYREPRSPKTSPKNPPFEKKDEQFRIGGRDHQRRNQQRNNSHHLRETSEGRPAAVAKPVDSKNIISKGSTAATNATPPWENLLEKKDEQHKVDEGNHQQRKTSHHLRQTSEERLTAIAKRASGNNIVSKSPSAVDSVTSSEENLLLEKKDTQSDLGRRDQQQRNFSRPRRRTSEEKSTAVVKHLSPTAAISTTSPGETRLSEKNDEQSENDGRDQQQRDVSHSPQRKRRAKSMIIAKSVSSKTMVSKSPVATTRPGETLFEKENEPSELDERDRQQRDIPHPEKPPITTKPTSSKIIVLTSPTTATSVTTTDSKKAAAWKTPIKRWKEKRNSNQSKPRSRTPPLSRSCSRDSLSSRDSGSFPTTPTTTISSHPTTTTAATATTTSTSSSSSRPAAAPSSSSSSSSRRLPTSFSLSSSSSSGGAALVNAGLYDIMF